MKLQSLVAACLVIASPVVARAQQSMPGMNMPMPAAPTPQQAPQKVKPKPNNTQQLPDPHAPDIEGMGKNSGNARAAKTAASERNSVQQQQSQTQTKPGTGSDQSSVTLPIETLQEPEAAELRTGSELPAPELLRDVVSREPMTLDSFMQSALQRNPTLAEAQRNIDRSLQQARQASLPPDPSVGYSAEHIRGGEYHGGEEGAFFSQTFVLGRKLALRRDIFRAEGHANEFAREMQLARVRHDVSAAFFDTLAAQQTVVVQDRLLKIAMDNEVNAHELERVGQADASNVLNAEIAAEQAKVDFEAAQRDFLAHFVQLASHAGNAGMPVHPLQGSLVQPPKLDAEAMVASDVEQSPMVKKAQAEVALAETRLKSARREAVPNLNVKAGEWYSGEELSGITRQTGWMSFAEAGVQLPLWNRNQGNKQAATAELERAQEDVLRAQLWTRKETEPYAQQYLSAAFTADRYRTEMLPRARRSYQLQVMKYQQMAQTYPEVLTAQHLLFTLQLSYIHALHEQWQAALALQNFALMHGLEQPEDNGEDTTMLNRPTEDR